MSDITEPPNEIAPDTLQNSKKAKILLARKEKQKRFGVIQESIFAYITPLMITVALAITVIVALSFGRLWVYFETNIPLNGLIIFLMLSAIFKAFYNNFSLYRTAKFLKRIEHTIQQDQITDEEIDELHYIMVKKAPFIDTQNMHDVIENIRTFGHLNMTDLHARLIKSKLGFRIRLKKSDVGFLAGILVMLGLLGTFLGLLKTIDAVGGALGSMSNLGGGENGVDESAMTEFIGSLAKPLQGMGLAFSSSLFGLSGSLMIGYFNHLCGGAQDTFIENVGRWIDEKIPKFSPDKKGKEKEKGKQEKPASKDDLHTWLTGFVHMSVKTNKRMTAFTDAVVQTLKALRDQEQILASISENQENIANETGNMTKILSSSTNSLESAFSSAQDSLLANSNAIQLQSESLNKLTAQNKTSHDTLYQSIERLDGSLKSIANDTQSQSVALIQKLDEMMISTNDTNTKQSEAIHVVSDKISNMADGIINEQQKTQKTLNTQLTSAEDATKTINQMSSTLSEVSQSLKTSQDLLNDNIKSQASSSQKTTEAVNYVTVKLSAMSKDLVASHTDLQKSFDAYTVESKKIAQQKAALDPDIEKFIKTIEERTDNLVSSIHKSHDTQKDILKTIQQDSKDQTDLLGSILKEQGKQSYRIPDDQMNTLLAKMERLLSQIKNVATGRKKAFKIRRNDSDIDSADE